MSAIVLIASCGLGVLAAESETPKKNFQHSKEVWGETVDGLQMGFRVFDVSRDNDEWKPVCLCGDQLTLEYRFRNTVKTDLTVEMLRPTMISVVAVDSKGKETIAMPLYSGPLSQFTQVLAPGASTEFSELPLLIEPPSDGCGLEPGHRIRARLAPGKYQLVVKCRNPNRGGELASGALAIEVSSSPDAQTKGAMAMLDRELDSFALTLCAKAGAPHPFVLLYVIDGVEREKYPPHCTLVRITREQAQNMIAFLGKTDFFPEALGLAPAAKDGVQRPPKELPYILKVSAGNGAPKHIPWVSMTAIQTTESACKYLLRLKDCVDEKSSARLDEVIRKIEASKQGSRTPLLHCLRHCRA